MIRPAQWLLDTDILLEVLAQSRRVQQAARRYLIEHSYFSFSILTKYEVLRGFEVSGLAEQVALFERFCDNNSVAPLSNEAIAEAARIYARLRRNGELIGDADILIAATAIVNGFGVVTNNEKHYRRIPGLTVENWLRETS